MSIRVLQVVGYKRKRLIGYCSDCPFNKDNSDGPHNSSSCGLLEKVNVVFDKDCPLPELDEDSIRIRGIADTDRQGASK